MSGIFWCITVFIAMVAGFFIYKTVSLKRALRQGAADLRAITGDLSANRVLHVPLADSDMEDFFEAVNAALGEIRAARIDYDRREQAFRAQIEAVSHDLRTPLTVIIGYLRFLERDRAQMDSDQQEMLATVQRKADAMAALVAQFYDYSRLAAGDMPLTLAPADVGKILRETFIDNIPLLEEAGLQVTTALPDAPAFALCDEKALARIFSNLLQNAARYAESRLHLALQKTADAVVITLENDTTTLSDSDLPHLFDRFYTPDPARQKNGTGLGLAIAQTLTQEMGGTLTAQLTNAADKDPRTIRFALTVRR